MLTKNKKKQIEGVDFNKSYSITEAVKLIKEKKYVKFDELALELLLCIGTYCRSLAVLCLGNA